MMMGLLEPTFRTSRLQFLGIHLLSDSSCADMIDAAIRAFHDFRH